MKSYKIFLHRKAERDVQRLPNKVLNRFEELMADLHIDPVPWEKWDLKYMVNLDDTYRVRIGDYHVVYWVNTDLHEIVILRVARRESVYDSD